MSLRTRITLCILPLVLVLTGCGGGSGSGNNNNVLPPPPNGAFNSSTLSGTYVFSFSGTDARQAGTSFFAMAGSLTANGVGNFTGGTIDISDPALGLQLNAGSVFTRLPITGNYTVTNDGRGSAVLTVTIDGQPVQFGLDFVLTSSSHGLISRFDANGTASGAIDLQSSSVTQSALQGSYAFALYGVDSTLSNALATVGAFTLDANGNVTAGLQDFNENGNSSNLQALSVSGTVTGAAPGPGAAQLTTTAEGFGSLQFDVWVVDSTHLIFIETDSTAYVEGDAFVSTGQTSFPSGALVFTLSGEDSANGPFVAGGLLTSNGSGQITGGLEDVNDQGDVAQAPNVTGSFTSGGTGRTVLTLNGIYNGSFANNAAGTGDYTFAAYPYNRGVLLLEIDNGGGSAAGISGGNIYVQSATTVASPDGYGLNLSGANTGGAVDWIAEFVASDNNLTGLYDANNLGALVTDSNLGGGSYAVSPNGRGTAQFPSLQTGTGSVISALDFTFYVVNSSTTVLIETDGMQVATGAFELQSASSAALTGQARRAVVRPRSFAVSHLTRPN